MKFQNPLLNSSTKVFKALPNN